MKGYTHITEDEQRRIERLLQSGYSLRKIARLLHRGAGTISEEVRRNETKGVYVARKARHKARVRRQQSKVQSLGVVQDSETRRYVESMLRAGWSPELVSGRLREVLGQKEAPSPKAIYKFVQSVYGRLLERYLPHRQHPKKSGPKRRRTVAIDGRRMIEERPKRVEKRLEFGHFEMDFIESGKEGKGSLLVLTERKSRYPFLVYTERRDTEWINQLVAETLREVPTRTITGDNDLSFQKHEELSELVGAEVFFCHPYHSWEKGTVENRNRAVRRHLPKRTDLSQVSAARFLAVEHALRHRPMKCLRFRSPFEVWIEEMRSDKIQQTRPVASPLLGRVLPVTMYQKCSA